MARAMYPHELGDADFSWLLSVYLESHPQYFQVDSSCMPVVLIERGLGVPVFGEDLPSILAEAEAEDEEIDSFKAKPE